LRTLQVVMDFCQGRWAGLDEVADKLGHELDSPNEAVDVHSVAGCLALARGNVDIARRTLAEVSHELETLCDWPPLALVVGATARCAAASADLAGVELIDRFLSALETKGYWSPLTRALAPITELLIATDQRSRASTLVERFAAQLADLDAPLAPAALAHARGFLDAAEGRAAAEAAASFLTAAGDYERLSCPYEAAQAREQAAAALFDVDAPAAERELRAALAAYRKLGARWDHARCVRLGRAHGLRLAATHRGGRKGYGDELSPRELEVAKLAARGLSNKAIAVELYLSPNTIEKHLGRLMPKLGVRSRAAIGVRLAERASGDDAG
jgi:DNA-binding CsgD family transcriptional regulator